MNFSASRLSAPALLAVLFMLPAASHAASRGEVASPTSFQLLSSAGADTPACHGTLVACGNRALKGLIPPEGSSPRVAYSFSDETFSFESGVDIMLQTASTRQPAEQGAHMDPHAGVSYSSSKNGAYQRYVIVPVMFRRLPQPQSPS